MGYQYAQLLVESARISMRRSRWIFSGLLFLTLSVFGACWNLYFSWLRSLFIAENFGNGEIIREARQLLLNFWIDSTFISFPIVGVRLSIADASFIISIGITAIMIWLLYSTRRENHIIGRSLRITIDEEAPLSIKKYVYYGITFSSLFMTMSNHDNPIRSIEYMEQEQKIFGLRGIFQLIFYVPFILILSIIIFDILSLSVIPSVFRENNVPVIFTNLPFKYQLHIIVMEATALIMGTITAFLGNRCRQYQNGTMEVLREYVRTQIYGNK